jgi:hypothetical protein
MESIEVPKFIPKTESPLFRKALISYNSGFYLAALAYLRAFIERFARRSIGNTERSTGDEIMSAYTAALPASCRDTAPSLRLWYEKISAPIHAAEEDSQTFESARSAIEQHFEIRYALRVPEP